MRSWSSVIIRLEDVTDDVVLRTVSGLGASSSGMSHDTRFGLWDMLLRAWASSEPTALAPSEEWLVLLACEPPPPSVERSSTIVSEFASKSKLKNCLRFWAVGTTTGELGRSLFRVVPFRRSPARLSTFSSDFVALRELCFAAFFVSTRSAVLGRSCGLRSRVQ